MFNEIGKKMMTFAEVMCWLGIAGFVLAGFIVMAVVSVGIGFAIAAGGALLSWLGRWTMYAFGQLVDDTRVIRNKVSVAAGAAIPADPAVVSGTEADGAGSDLPDF